MAKTAHFFTTLVTVPFHSAANFLNDLTHSASRPRTSSSTAQGRRGSAVRDIYLGKNNYKLINDDNGNVSAFLLSYILVKISYKHFF